MKWETKFNTIYNTCFFSLFIFSLFGVYSCVNSYSTPQEKSFTQEVYEEVVEKVEEDVLSDKWMEDRIKIGWYKGHEFLIYGETGNRYGSIIHNPNCPCNNEE